MKRLVEWVARTFGAERRIIINDEVYLRRYYLFGSMPPNLAEKWNVDTPKQRLGFLPTFYLHKFEKPDAGRNLHDHPWHGLSLVLVNGYVEMLYDGPPVEGNEVTRRLRPGMLNRIRPLTYHRVDGLPNGPAWTLIVIWGKQRDWGYWLRDEGRFASWKEVHGGDTNTHNEPYKPKG